LRKVGLDTEGAGKFLRSIEASLLGVRLIVVFATLALAAPLPAQSTRVQLDLVLPTTMTVDGEGPNVVTANLLANGKTRELLRNGFPTALHFRAELWRKSRWFDDQAGMTEWDVLVQYDPASQLYRVVRQHGDNQLEDFGGFASLTTAEAQINRAYRIPLRPSRPGRYYYNLSLDIETLRVTDLDALQRWLRGEFQPAVRGKRSPVSALRKGVETLFSRVLGGESRRYEQRSGVFRVN
jgi:hypothetical protein